MVGEHAVAEQEHLALHEEEEHQVLDHAALLLVGPLEEGPDQQGGLQEVLWVHSSEEHQLEDLPLEALKEVHVVVDHEEDLHLLLEELLVGRVVDPQGDEEDLREGLQVVHEADLHQVGLHQGPLVDL